MRLPPPLPTDTHTSPLANTLTHAHKNTHLSVMRRFSVCFSNNLLELSEQHQKLREEIAQGQDNAFSCECLCVLHWLTQHVTFTYFTPITGQSCGSFGGLFKDVLSFISCSPAHWESSSLSQVKSNSYVFQLCSVQGSFCLCLCNQRGHFEKAERSLVHNELKYFGQWGGFPQ